MGTLFHDLRYAARTLRKVPAFAITAVLTIALGIGATPAIFSVVNAVLLRPLPYNDAARLGTVWSDLRNRNVVDFPLPPGDFHDMRKDTTLFDGFAAITSFRRPPSAATDRAKPNRSRPRRGHDELLQPARHRIPIGRDFVEADGTPQPPPPARPRPRGAGPPPPAPQPPPAAAAHRDHQPRILAAPLRRQRSDRRHSRSISATAAPTSSACSRPDSRSCSRRAPTSIPRPTSVDRRRVNFETGSRNNVSLRVVAQLQPGVSFEQAQSELDRLSADLRTRFPIKQTSNMNLRIEPMHDDLVADVRPRCWR